MVKNEKNELIPTRIQNSWRVCIDYRRLNHFPLPFMDQMLDRLAGFYRRFIKDFSKIANPLSNLLQKDVAFDFRGRCKDAFDTLKKALTTTPIIQPHDWTLPFKLMCDASNFAVGAVLA